MTTYEKTEITRMRGDGMGYSAIARKLGISENTIKSFCRRNGLTKQGADPFPQFPEIAEKPCLCCGKPVIQYPGRKEKKFCSDACRYRWWNSHTGEAGGKAMHAYTCPACGKSFSAYGSRNRRYCSHGCYISARFGGAV